LKAELIDGNKIAKEVRSEVADGVANLKDNYGVTPGLAVVLVGDDPASAVYVGMKQKAALKAGMESRDIRLPGNISEDQLIREVSELGKDPNLHGILVQLPLPEHINVTKIIGEINPSKDVDGLHPINVGLMVQGREKFVPATPAGIQQLLVRTGYDPEGKHIVVCGRSEIVGKPLAILLMQRKRSANATVTVCHTRTKNLPEMTRQADVLIAAMGQPGIITADMVKQDAVVIDVGTNRIDAPEKKRGYRLVGDVDFNKVSEKASAITPVPGGVGPMTIAMLLSNTLDSAKWIAENNL